jgi:3-deoxy-D-manno-octulosonic-acid transferase
MTATGNEMAKKSLPQAEAVLFFPLDQSLLLGRMIKKIKPGLLLIAETELWPNLFRVCGKKNIPLLLFNGRISDRSFPNYLFFRFFFRACLKYVSLFLMQTEKDRQRIIKIGASRERTRVVGNIKFDQEVSAISLEERTALAQSLYLKGEEKIIIGGSTHSGEEEILCSLFKGLKETCSNLLLILAPRHLNRLEEVEGILNRMGLSWMKRTSFLPGQSSSNRKRERPEVILLDTMGELVKFYSLGTLIFIGGSLVPVGGHNPIEPLFYRKCVFFGPHMFNFLEISSLLVDTGGAIQVRGKEELASQWKDLLSDEKRCEEFGERGYQFLLRHRGATERMMKEIRPFLVQMRNAVGTTARTVADSPGMGNYKQSQNSHDI